MAAEVTYLRPQVMKHIQPSPRVTYLRPQALSYWMKCFVILDECVTLQHVALSVSLYMYIAV